MIEKIKRNSRLYRSKVQVMPKTAIILGTGLGVGRPHYRQELKFLIPRFPISRIDSRRTSELIFGKLGKKDVMAMQGRFSLLRGIRYETSYLLGACHFERRE